MLAWNRGFWSGPRGPRREAALREWQRQRTKDVRQGITSYSSLSFFHKLDAALVNLCIDSPKWALLFPLSKRGNLDTEKGNDLPKDTQLGVAELGIKPRSVRHSHWLPSHPHPRPLRHTASPWNILNRKNCTSCIASDNFADYSYDVIYINPFNPQSWPWYKLAGSGRSILQAEYQGRGGKQGRGSRNQELPLKVKAVQTSAFS